MLIVRLRYSLAPAPPPAACDLTGLPEGPESPIAKPKDLKYRLITVGMHHRRARVTRSVKNLSLNAISMISGIQLSHSFVDERRTGRLYRHACVWQKRPCLCRTNAPTLDYPLASKIG